MSFETGFGKFKEGTYRLSRVINGAGVFLLLAIMFLLVAEVISRRFFSRSFTGTYEVVQFMLVTLVFLGVAYTGTKKDHIVVDLVLSRFSPRFQHLVDSLTTFLSFSLLGLITWRNILRARELWLKGEVSYLLSVPFFPFYYLLAFGCAVLSLVLLVQFLEDMKKVRASFSGKACISLYGSFAIVLVILFALFTHKIAVEVSPFITGITGIGVLLLLLAARMPIAFALGLVGFMGYSIIVDPGAGLMQLETVPFGVGSDYILSVVPLFLLMGQFAFYSGLSQDLYDTSYKWLGHYPGGLAMATVGGCAAFAAVSGSSVATAATMGTVALPGMKKYNYDDRLALGSIAAGGTIGILIPPSIVFILYGILTEQSIGKLFLAGILPGILTVILYFSTILILVRINPTLGPPGPKTSTREKLGALRQTWGMLLLFFLVMGGIYLGFFTPTEAGAVGAFGAFLLALLRNRLTPKGVYECLLETGRTTAMLIIIFVGAMVFNYFMAVTNLPMDMAQLIAEHGFHPYTILAAILLTYLLLGCIMDPGSMIILTIPIVYPLIQSVGFDPIWFGVVIVMVAEIGAITPPVGLNVFVVKGVAPDVPIAEIFRGIVPFWLADMVRLFILVVFPRIALILPAIMKGS
ncbi:MAG: TRAP transporter large permease subunit [Deltaproteobacteria bacterium]|nr:TRAP transporter large permease subunit [Deltaproteobacteria bacterium]